MTERAVIRAVRSEARGDEQTRILDVLRQAAHHAEQAAASSARPAVTGFGRRAAGLRAAVELIESTQPGYVGDEWSTVGTYDSVGIHYYDPSDDPDEWPVRLVACDNADSTTACVYLSIDEAERHFREGLELVDKLRQDRADREARGSTDEAASG